MKHLVAILAAVAALPAQELPERYRSAGVLRWASDAEGGAPFVYADPADPTHEIGFEVDIAAALQDALGVRLVRVQTPWDHLVEGLNRGDFDFVMNGLEPTPDRLPLVRFTRPYYIFQQQLSAMAGAGITALADCAGKRVGCLGQSASHVVLMAHPEIETVVYEDPSKIYLDISNGRNAAGIADLPIAMVMQPRYPGMEFAGEPFGEFYYAIAVRLGERDLQLALDAAVVRLLQDGTLERVYRRWNMWSPVQQRLGDPALARLVAGQALGDSEPTFDWAKSLVLMLRGALRTIGISVAAFALAVGLGLVIALARCYGPRPLQWAMVAYVELFRGTPVLVQLLFLYYGLGQMSALQLPAWVAGILGLGLNYAAYEAEIYRGAISAVPRGQVEASLALGLSGAQTVRFVVLPQALRLSLAPSTNDFIALFKDSSMVMVITVVELTKQYSMLASASGYHISLGLLTCALYLAMSIPLAWCARRFERALDRDRA